jgi:hypothetical protein
VSRIRANLTYANAMATVAVFVALGGAAYAAGTVGSADVIDNSLGSVDLKNNAAVQGHDVRNGTLSGADIAPQTGVDTCIGGSTRYGPLCALVSAGGAQGWSAAQDTCAVHELRLPSLGEALALAVNHDIPTSTESSQFWTEEFYSPQTDFRVWTVNDAGSVSNDNKDTPKEVVCVTTPTN